MNPYKKIPQEFQRIGNQSVFGLVFSLLVQAASLILIAWGLSEHLSDLLLNETLGEPVWTYMLLGGAILRFAGGLLESSSATSSGQKAENKFRSNLLDRLFEPGPHIEASSFSTAFTRGASQMGDYFRIYAPASLKASLFPLLIGISILYADPLSGLILFVAMPVMVVMMILTGKLAAGKREQKWEKLQALRHSLLDKIHGIAEARSLGAEKKLLDEVESSAYRFRKLTVQVLKTVFLSSLVLELAATISTALIAVQSGIRLVYDKMDYAPALFTLILVPEFFRALRELGAARHSAMEAEESMKAYSGVIEGKPPVEQGRRMRPCNLLHSSNCGRRLDDEASQNNSSRSPLRSTTTTVPEEEPRWGPIIAALALGLFAPLSQVGLMMCGGVLLSLAAIHTPLAALHIPIAGVRFFGLARAVLRYTERLGTHNASLLFFKDVRTRILAQMFRLPANRLKKLHSGSLLRSIDEDTEAIDMVLPGVLFPLASSFILVLILPFIPPLSYYEPGWMVKLTLWILWLIPFAFYKFIPVADSMQKGDELAVESVMNRKEIIMEGSTERKAALQSLMESHTKDEGAYHHRVRTLVQVQNLLITIALFILLLLFPSGNSQEHFVYTAGMLFGILAIGELFGAIPNSLGLLRQGLQSIHHIQENTEWKAYAGLKTVDDNFTGIEMKGLDFQYDKNGRKILEDFHLKIEPGEFVGILGDVGSGKTTLLELMTGFLDPSPGMLSFNGEDILSLEKTSLIKSFAYQSQRSHIFAGSIRENLQLANEGLDDTSMLDALHLTGLDLDKKFNLESPVGENGKLLSGGERQRLLLARTLLQKRPILILDEPFNNLDMETRTRLVEHLRSLKGTVTLLFVSHQKDGLELMDKIIQLD